MSGKVTQGLRAAGPQGRALALVLLMLGVAGCALLPQRRPAQPPPSLAAQEAQIHTLRAQFKATVTNLKGRRSATGVLVVRKPDRFRVRLAAGFGMTVMDYLSVGERIRLDLPMSRTILFDAQVDDGNAFHAADLRAAFLRGHHAYPGECRSTLQGEWTTIECGTRRLRVRDGDLLEESAVDAAGVRMSTTYGDIRDVNGMRLPHTISMQYPRDDVQLDVVVQRYEINPELEDQLFQAEGWQP